MSDSLPTLSASALSMSSREVAELAGKLHKNVIRDIRGMLKRIHEVGDGSDLSHEQIQGVTIARDERGYISIIHLDKDHTLTLLTGYDAKARFRVVRRWLELETQTAAAIPQSFADALQFAADQQRLIEQQHAQLAEIEPKAQALDLISSGSEGSLNITETAKTIKVKPKALFQWMHSHQWIYRRPGGSGWIAYQNPRVRHFRADTGLVFGLNRF